MWRLGDGRTDRAIEKVAADDGQIADAGVAQGCGKVAVDLVRDDRPRARGERPRQRSAARADLDEGVVRPWVDLADDLLDPRRLEKVLPEALARKHHSDPPGSWIGSRM